MLAPKEGQMDKEKKITKVAKYLEPFDDGWGAWLRAEEIVEILNAQPESDPEFRPFIIHHLGKDKYEIFPLETDEEIANRKWQEWFAECVDTVNITNYNIHFNMKNPDGVMFPNWIDKEE